MIRVHLYKQGAYKVQSCDTPYAANGIRWSWSDAGWDTHIERPGDEPAVLQAWLAKRGLEAA